MPENITNAPTERTVDSLLSIIKEMVEKLGSYLMEFCEKIIGGALPPELRTSVGDPDAFNFIPRSCGVLEAHPLVYRNPWLGPAFHQDRFRGAEIVSF